jgi:1,2-phenylacetyl-CoA epoxidase PaaB subunit
MSKLRQNVDLSHLADELPFTTSGDLPGYVIFTQLKSDGPFIYAGWLNAADPEMALLLAREHYGQDQECVHIWAAPRQFVGGLRENLDASAEPVAEPRKYRIFTQKNAGDQHFSSIEVTASCAADAIDLARTTVPDAQRLHNIWAIPTTEITATNDDDLIWRYTDQSYRLARGYSKDVRDKWEKVRAERDLEEYEKEDLKEMF